MVVVIPCKTRSYEPVTIWIVIFAGLADCGGGVRLALIFLLETDGLATTGSSLEERFRFAILQNTLGVMDEMFSKISQEKKIHLKIFFWQGSPDLMTKHILGIISNNFSRINLKHPLKTVRI